MTYLLIAILTSLFVTPAISQNASDEAQFRLSLAGGKSVYRSGEPIRLVISFTSDADGYQLNTATTKPAPAIDEILLTPDEGVFNWLDEYSGKRKFTLDHISMQKITTAPVIVELTLNDWFRFDRPGKYTVKVRTRRVSRPERSPDHASVIPLTSNEVSFEVVAMSKAEEERVIRRLSAPLDEITDREEEARISEEFSYLAGEASTREKARRYFNSRSRSGTYIQNIRLGLFIARDRTLVIQLLEGALQEPNLLDTYQLLPTLTKLRLLQEGREPPSIVNGIIVAGEQERKRSMEILGEYLGELTASLPKRTGKSRTKTAITILTSLSKDADWAAQMMSAARKVILQEFDNLPPHEQEYLLRTYWGSLRDPSLKTALERILTKERNPLMSGIRASALKHLMELDLDRSRSFVVAELINPDSLVDPDLLQALKDDTLPEADAALLQQIRRLAPLKQNRDSDLLRHKTLLAARYASPAIYDGLKEVYETWGAKWEAQARGGLLGYLARYNESLAMPLIEQALEELGTDRSAWLLDNLTRSNYPKAIGELLRKRLESEDPQVMSSAAYVMSQGGPAEVREFIEARLDRWIKEWGGRGAELDAAGDNTKMFIQRMAQVNLVQALLTGKAWKLSEEKINQLMQSCVTKACRQHFHVQ